MVLKKFVAMVVRILAPASFFCGRKIVPAKVPGKEKIMKDLLSSCPWISSISKLLLPPSIVLMLRFFTRSALSLIIASASTCPARCSSASRPAFIAAYAQSPPSAPSTSCQATMTASVAAESTDLPRWDLSRFGFSSPFSDEIDSHLEETAKLAEAFKVRTSHHNLLYKRIVHI